MRMIAGLPNYNCRLLQLTAELKPLIFVFPDLTDTQKQSTDTQKQSTDTQKQ